MLRRVLVGLEERLLAPELVEEFVRTYVAEVNAANRDAGARRAGLEQQQVKLARQMQCARVAQGRPWRCRDGRGTAGSGTAPGVARGRDCCGGMPELVPTLHPNLRGLYRRHLQRLEAALADPGTAMAATETPGGLIDAILVFPESGVAR
jgi:hypothetical protein